MYRLHKAPAKVQEKWLEMQNDPDAGKVNEFMQTVIESKDGFDDEFLRKCETITNEQTTGEDGAWISWAKASAEEGGDDILFEMVKAQTVRLRRNPKLPPNSAIPYPRDQQVEYVKEVCPDSVDDVEIIVIASIINIQE